jgi:hypothetical protein
MEKRAAPRFPSAQAVLVTLLDAGSDNLDARIENISGTGARLLLSRPIACGALLKLEWEDTLLLGEVCYCQPLEGGDFAAGLQLQHALLQTGELARLSRRLLCEDKAAPARQPSR